MKKVSVFLSSLVISAMLLGACQTSTPATAPTQAPSSTEALPPTATALPTETPAPTATVPPAPTPAISGTIRVQTYDSSEFNLGKWQEAIASFEAAYPNVNVEFKSVPQNSIETFMQEADAGGGADIVQVSDGDVSRIAQGGYFEPLDPYMSGEMGMQTLDPSVFFESVLTSGQYNGTTYVLPRDYNPVVFFYNKDLFDAAGLAYPTDDWTWDDLLTAAQALTLRDGSGKVTQWGFTIRDGAGNPYWQRGLWAFIYQNGNDMISADGTRVSGHLDSDETVQAIQWYADLFTTHKVTPTRDLMAASGSRDLFVDGKSAMQFTGFWELYGYTQNTNISLGVAQLPQGTQRGNSLTWRGFAMNSKSQNKDAAWIFLRWISADEGAKVFATAGLTPLKSIVEEWDWANDPNYGPVVADIPYLHPAPFTINPKYYSCVGFAFDDWLADVYLKSGGDLQSQLTDMAAKADTCLGQ